MTLIASHRGGALEWPENSPTAFAETAKLAVDQVEFDIHPTNDGEIVVFHDATLERTSDGHGEVAEHSLAALKALVLKGTNDEAMLTLAEFAAVFAPTAITLRMELKSDARQVPYPGLLHKALAVLDAVGLRARTIVTSFNVAVAQEAAGVEGLQGAIWLVSPDRQAEIGVSGVVEMARVHGVSRVGIRCTSLDAPTLAALRDAGLGVGSWATNETLDIAGMLALGVDVFTTDRPSQALLLRDGVQPQVGLAEVDALSGVGQSVRDELLALPDTRAAHTTAHAGVAAFGEVETGGVISAALTGKTLRIGAWNLERCLYPEGAAAMLREQGVSLALLTEVDNGCHRTGQRHTIRDVAEMVGQRYAYGLEFIELATMPQPFPLADTSDGNLRGFHGNGLVSSLPFSRPVVIRLGEIADWYVHPRSGQKRIGTRMAVAATFDLDGTEVVACSVHLESAADASGRALQFQRLLDAIDDYARARPVVIGGDLNTHVYDPDELLFDLARERGYDWASCNVGSATTRPSVWSDGAGDFTLDWFCTRGFSASAPQVVPALGEGETVLSDHDLIVVDLSV